LVVRGVGEARGVGSALEVAFGFGFVGGITSAGGEKDDERRDEQRCKDTGHDEAPVEGLAESHIADVGAIGQEFGAKAQK
jgi:hypothetical protein